MQTYAGQEDSPISGKLTVAMHKNEKVLKPYLKAFKKKYPKVKVKYLHLEDYENTISEMLARDTAPDVFLVPSPPSL